VLARRGIGLVDCQVHTEHLARFGAEEWPRERFLEALAAALRHPTRKGTWRLETIAGQ
jgi:leucyl/phenylalanyl-tRNA--protein transferase